MGESAGMGCFLLHGAQDACWENIFENMRVEVQCSAFIAPEHVLFSSRCVYPAHMPEVTN